MMTPDQIRLVEKLREEFKTVSTAGYTPFDDRSLSQFLKSHDLTEVSIFPFQSEVSGFGESGQADLIALAKSVRESDPTRSRAVSNEALKPVLRELLAAVLRVRDEGPFTEEELQAIEARIVAWFESHQEVRTHYIPCIISPWPDRAFGIGPVRFFHASDFPVTDFNLTKEQFDSLEESGDFYGLTELKNFMRERHADWIAVADIADREPATAATSADLAVDVALAILQLATPLQYYRSAARSTSRITPAWRPNVVRTANGGGSSGVANLQPGRSVAPEGLGRMLAANAAVIGSMGSRLTGYVDGISALPVLDEAWCNAAYWYHEALAESLETVAIAKLETSIEVLFRSESSRGSTSRLVAGLETFFGLKSDDLLPDGSMTAGELAAAIVSARSRVLHGTWQTLTSDMPEVRGGKAISFEQTENIARSLLIAVSVAIDKYAMQEAPLDQVEQLLEWCQQTNPAMSPSVEDDRLADSQCDCAGAD